MYDFVDSVRLDAHRCGPEGKLFASLQKNVRRPAQFKSLFAEDDEE